VAELRIGTAGWSVPAALADKFPAEGTSLERYATRLACAEINSTFHRSHRPATYDRWRASVPPDFRFSAKLPKAITHQHKLAGCDDLVDPFLDEVPSLAESLAILLIQLPPSLAWDAAVSGRFLEVLASRTRVQLVCEPRHATWFLPEADDVLNDLRIARVAADPVKVRAAAVPGGWRGLSYYRLHGSPVVYRSSYDDGRLETYAAAIAQERAEGRPVWCIFDNTASSAATGDALKLQALTSR
jgi:uncharacterized protein YecE (DUF72 family)